jgi:hypothetical protein
LAVEAQSKDGIKAPNRYTLWLNVALKRDGRETPIDRRETPEGGSPDAGGVGRQTPIKQEVKPIRETSPLPPKGKDEVPTRFNEFWECWPANERKQDKKKCEGKWKALGLDKVADTILRDVKAKKLTRKWVDGYVEAPLVYIHNARWEDGASKASALKPGSDEYMQAHKNASWWKDAGFSSVYEAANKRCWHHNAKDFANGAKKEMA